MSNVNILRAVENIRSGTSIYTPLIEVVVNAIQAIESTGRDDGKVTIEIRRANQAKLDGSKPEIEGFFVHDNGEGFTEENRNAFDTLYTDRRIDEGGKGFGRFTCLKYYHDVFVDSEYKEGEKYYKRTFKMGKKEEIIIEEQLEECKAKDNKTTVKLLSPRSEMPEKTTTSLSRTLVEKLLPFFIDVKRTCPLVVLIESDGSDEVILNEYLQKANNPLIQEATDIDGNFVISSSDKDHLFTARVFRIYSSKTKVSKISLVAHRREVTSVSLHNYIPEFAEEFYDENAATDGEKGRCFIVKVYVLGNYLDEHVSLERGGFEFQREQDLLYGISQKDIEEEASVFGQEAVQLDIAERSSRKAESIQSYVTEQAPWYNSVLKDVDFSEFPYNPTEDQIESRLHQHNHRRELEIRSEVKGILKNDKFDEVQKSATEIVSKLSSSSRNELVHYVALRKCVLDIFEKSLTVGEDGKYRSEGVVHDVIFPRHSDVTTTSFESHNLWIIDERLNFTEYLSSDQPLDDPNDARPDLLAYNKRICFRGDNEVGNPVTIFELKRPQRDDFVNPSSAEDPIQQLIRYAIKIKDSRFKTPEGRNILVSDSTPFYGFVVCDLTRKVKEWLENEKDFKPMPDQLGYFNWHDKLNMYIEVLSWDKLLRDAKMRNKVFFHKLGI